jgi:hypothetical protein
VHGNGGDPISVMIWMHVDVLLHESVAVQVRVIVELVGLGDGCGLHVPT